MTLAFGLCQKKGDYYRLVGSVEVSFEQSSDKNRYLIVLSNTQKIVIDCDQPLEIGDVIQVDTAREPQSLGLARHFYFDLTQTSMMRPDQADFFDKGLIAELLEAPAVSGEMIQIHRTSFKPLGQTGQWLSTFSKELSPEVIYAQDFSDQKYPLKKFVDLEGDDFPSLMEEFIQSEQEQALERIPTSSYYFEELLKMMVTSGFNSGQAFTQEHEGMGRLAHGQFIHYNRRYSQMLAVSWGSEFASLSGKDYVLKEKFVQNPALMHQFAEFVGIHEFAHCLDDRINHHQLPIFESFADSFALLALGNKYPDLEMCELIRAGRWIAPLMESITHATGPACDRAMGCLYSLKEEGRLGTLTPTEILHLTGTLFAQMPTKSYMKQLEALSKFYIEREMAFLDAEPLTPSRWAQMSKDGALPKEFAELIKRSVHFLDKMTDKMSDLSETKQQARADLLLHDFDHALQKLPDVSVEDFIGMADKLRSTYPVALPECDPEVPVSDTAFHQRLAQGLEKRSKVYGVAWRAHSCEAAVRDDAPLESFQLSQLAEYKGYQKNHGQKLSPEQRVQQLTCVLREEMDLVAEMLAKQPEQKSFSAKERHLFSQKSLKRQVLAQACFYDPHFVKAFVADGGQKEELRKFLGYLSFDDLPRAGFSAYSRPRGAFERHQDYLTEKRTLLALLAKAPSQTIVKRRPSGPRSGAHRSLP